MRRSLFFFTFVFAISGCGSDPTIASESNQEEPQERAGEPSIVETEIRPPTMVGMDDVTRIDDSRVGQDDNAAIDLEQKLAARRFSNRAVLESPYRLQCSFLPICLEAAYRDPSKP